MIEILSFSFRQAFCSAIFGPRNFHRLLLRIGHQRGQQLARVKTALAIVITALITSVVQSSSANEEWNYFSTPNGLS